MTSELDSNAEIIDRRLCMASLVKRIAALEAKVEAILSADAALEQGLRETVQIPPSIRRAMAELDSDIDIDASDHVTGAPV